MSRSSEVEALAAQHLERHAAVLGGRDAVPLQLEAAREQQAVHLVVVGDEQARRARGAIHAWRSSRERRGDARVLARERVERIARRASSARASPASSSSRAMAPRASGAEGVGVGLERVRGAAEALGVAPASGARAGPPASRALPRGRCPPARPRTRRPAVSCRRLKVAGRSIVSRHVSRASLRPHQVQGLDQPLHADRLGEVVVHAGGQAQVAVALHRVGGHGDDARALARPPARADRGAWPPGRPSPASARPSARRRRPAARPTRPPPGRWPRGRRGSPSAAGCAARASGSRRCPRRAGCAAGGARPSRGRCERAVAPRPAARGTRPAARRPTSVSKSCDWWIGLAR